MEKDPLSKRKAQLDKAEREHLEGVVEDLRERVEDNVRFQLKQKGLDEEPANVEALEDDTQELIEAIEFESVDGLTWDGAFEEYVTGAGYTIVNRLAALRCMEVRGFIDEEVTVFKENGLTPAAETLVQEEFLLEDEAILSAYLEACDELAEEIEILFDRSTAYSLVEPDRDTYEELCAKLDEVPDRVWLGDDVLGWVYEYYNTAKLSDIRKKARSGNLDVGDVSIANQFYTPHWVVRMLADNSLGKLYLEQSGDLSDVVKEQKELNIEERKNRGVDISKSPSVGDLCTYLVPSDVSEYQQNFENPADIRVIDPACGSGHFLLYAFDILERIWREERPDLSPQEIPSEILENNLYGVDIDLRACQLAAFNLYLKARTRAEIEGKEDFEIPKLGIVCADAKIANVDSVQEVFEEISEGRSDVKDTLENIFESFEDIQGLGSLLNVRKSLADQFQDGSQLTLGDSFDTNHSLSSLLRDLREKLADHRGTDSFLAQDLRSFLNLLEVLSQTYDVALMNPPYGSQRRMPNSVKKYVRENYDYHPEFYINFFEVCERLVTEGGRIGMLVPRSFMYNQSFEEFRKDFIGQRGSFDFLAEYGLGVLDNATVRTAGTVVRTGKSKTKSKGTFFRLHDVPSQKKEETFIKAAYEDRNRGKVRRVYHRKLSEFDKIPGAHISYWMSDDLRSIYDSDVVFDAGNADVNKDSLGVVKQGTTTGKNARFLRYFWEQSGGPWVPFAKGGEDAWILPRVNRNVIWEQNGKEVRRYSGSVPQNTQHFFKEALTYTVAKETGRRFGYLHPHQAFDAKGSVFIPNRYIWDLLAYSNSELINYLMLCQTPERMWQVGMVSKLPWEDNLAENRSLEDKSKQQLRLMLGLRQNDITSPFYTGPLLLRPLGEGEKLGIHDHPHRDIINSIGKYDEIESVSADVSIHGLGEIAKEFQSNVWQKIESIAEDIDHSIYDYYNVDDEQINEIKTEIDLRTVEDPFVPLKERSDLGTSSLENHVKELLHYLVLKILEEDDDGVVPVNSGSHSSVIDLLVDEFKSIFGENAQNRLSEIDDVLGSKIADEYPFPNLRNWIINEFFDEHISKFENCPIIWKITTKDLVSDTMGEGFSCFVLFNKLDSGLFDRISNKYLEPHKADLRQKMNAANRRRSDDSLTVSEKSAAQEEFERTQNAIEQISVFEGRIQNIVMEDPRTWNEKDRALADELAGKVAEFRDETQARLDNLESLRKLKEEEWLVNSFSPTFFDTVDENREEWISALNDLEEACTEYSNPRTEPIEAHHYDQFTYFSDVAGSDHYSSNGILFMTYYFEREGEKFTNTQNRPKDGLVDTGSKLLAKLAADLDNYKQLAKDIEDLCSELHSRIPSKWEDRAISEITTTGYRPVQKHGVAINIIPLVNADIVPKNVKGKVI